MIKAIAREFHSDSGFSIVELLVAIAVFVILLAGVLFVFEFGLTNANALRFRSAMNVQAENIMEKMTRQIRCARQFVVPAIATGMDVNPISFVADVRGDGTNRNVMFYRTTADNRLYSSEKKTTEATWTSTELGRMVTSLTFTYYNADGVSLGNAITDANKSSIKRVDITFVMRKTFSNGNSPIVINQTGSVVVRCLVS